VRKTFIVLLTISTVLIGFAFGWYLNSSSSSEDLLPQPFDSELEPIVMEEPLPLPPPPVIQFSVSQHKKRTVRDFFKSCNLSGNRKELINACDYDHSEVRNKSVELAGQNPGELNVGQICDVFDYCFKNWKYVNDPAQNEIVELASNSLANGLNGDCDDFAVLVCSMILAIGGDARINYAHNSESGHAFTEVNIGNTNVQEYIRSRYRDNMNSSEIFSRKDQQGNQWLNLDWFANHPGGKYFDFANGTTYYILQKVCTDIFE
jgi:hypothetical protein